MNHVDILWFSLRDTDSPLFLFYGSVMTEKKNFLQSQSVSEMLARYIFHEIKCTSDRFWSRLAKNRSL